MIKIWKNTPNSKELDPLLKVYFDLIWKILTTYNFNTSFFSKQKKYTVKNNNEIFELQKDKVNYIK